MCVLFTHIQLLCSVFFVPGSSGISMRSKMTFERYKVSFGGTSSAFSICQMHPGFKIRLSVSTQLLGFFAVFGIVDSK